MNNEEENNTEENNTNQEPTQEVTSAEQPANDLDLEIKKEELKQKRNKRLITQAIVILLLVLGVSEGNPINNILDATPIGPVIDSVKSGLGIDTTTVTENEEKVKESEENVTVVEAVTTTLGEVEEVVIESDNVEEVELDEEAPSWPSPSISFSDVTQTSFTFTWDFATDNVGISQYQISINAVGAGTVDETVNTYTINGAVSNSEYKVSIVAVDQSGNLSGALSSTVVTLEAAAEEEAAAAEEEEAAEEEASEEEDSGDGSSSFGIGSIIPDAESLLANPEISNVYVLPPSLILNACATDTTPPTYALGANNIVKPLSVESPAIAIFRIDDNCGLSFDTSYITYQVQKGTVAGRPVYLPFNVNYLDSARFYISGSTNNNTTYYEEIYLGSKALAYDEEDAKYIVGVVEFYPELIGNQPGEFLIYGVFTDSFGNEYQDEVASLTVTP